MTVYFVMLICIYIASFIKKRLIQKIIILLIFFFVSSFRYIYLGIDTYRYINYFQYFNKISFKEIFFNKSSIEKGFIILNKTLSLVSNNERYFIVVTSFIVIILLARFIENNSKIPWLSFYLFLSLGYYINSLNILRQIIAMLILLNSLSYVRRRDIKIFLIYYFIAVSIHSTAVFFIFIYLLYPLKINLKYIIFSLMCGCFLYIFSSKILNLFFSLSDKYMIRYSDSLRSGNGKGMLLMLGSVLFLAYFLEKINIKRDKNYLFYHMLNIAVISQLISLKFALFVRVVNYFSIGLIVFIPNITYKIKQKNLRALVNLVICVITSYYLYIILKRDLSSVVPYKFYFNIR